MRDEGGGHLVGPDSAHEIFRQQLLPGGRHHRQTLKLHLEGGLVLIGCVSVGDRFVDRVC